MIPRDGRFAPGWNREIFSSFLIVSSFSCHRRTQIGENGQSPRYNQPLLSRWGEIESFMDFQY